MGSHFARPHHYLQAVILNSGLGQDQEFLDPFHHVEKHATLALSAFLTSAF